LFEISDAPTVHSAVAADIFALANIMRMFSESHSRLSKPFERALAVCDSCLSVTHTTPLNHATLCVIQAVEQALGWQQGADNEDVASLIHYVHEGLDSRGSTELTSHQSIHTVAMMLSEAARLLTDMARFGPQHHRESVCTRSAAAVFIRLAAADSAELSHPAIFSLCELVLHFGGTTSAHILQEDGLALLARTVMQQTNELGMKACQAVGVLVASSDDCRAAVLKAGAVQSLLSSVNCSLDQLLRVSASSIQSRTIGAQVTSSMSALRQLCEIPSFQQLIVADGGVDTLSCIFNSIILSGAITQHDRTLLLGDAAFVAATLALVPPFRSQLIDAGMAVSVMEALVAHKFVAGEWRRWTGDFVCCFILGPPLSPNFILTRAVRRRCHRISER
jgi:hypothetical protein